MFKDLITSFESYSHFVRKIKYARLVFLRIAKVTAEDSYYLRKHSRSFICLLSKFRQKHFDETKMVLDFLTKKNIELAMNDQFLLIEYPTTSINDDNLIDTLPVKQKRVLPPASESEHASGLEGQKPQQKKKGHIVTLPQNN